MNVMKTTSLLSRRSKDLRRLRQRAAGLFLGGFLAVSPAFAAPLWFSQSYIDDIIYSPTPALAEMHFMAAAEAVAPSVRVFDIMVSLHSNPRGDDNGNTQDDTSPSEQDKIEWILQHFADAVYESTEGSHRIGTVRVFRNSSKDSVADIVWDEKGRAGTTVNGISKSSDHIFIYDVSKWCDLEIRLMDRAPIAVGYTLAHEWGHYAYGLLDEYAEVPLDASKKDVCPEDYAKSQVKTKSDYQPKQDDYAVNPSIMNRQAMATILKGQQESFLVDSRWLNFSIKNYGGTYPDFSLFENTMKTAHHRRYGESGWETLTRELNVLEKIIPGGRRYYPELAAVAPSEGVAPDFWPCSPSSNSDPTLVCGTISPSGARNALNIIWMKPDITLEIVIDRSGSMSGTPIQNAKKAAQWLVDTVPEGTTSIGVIAFSSSPTTIVPITQVADAASRDLISV